MRSRILWTLVFGSLIYVSIFSVGYFHADEHFQILEFANYKMGGIEGEHLPWEFHNQMRPTLQVYMAQGLTEIGDATGLSRFGSTFLMRLLSGIVSGITLIMLFRMLKRKLPEANDLSVIFPAMSLIFIIPMLGVRFSSEIWAGSFFFIGFVLFDQFKITERRSTLVLAMILFGFSFWFRYHTAFMSGYLIIHWLLKYRPKIKTIMTAASGLIGTLAFGVILDSVFYGNFTFAPWNYMEYNIIKGTMNDQFGVEPIWFFAQQLFERPTPLFLLILIPAIIIFARRKVHPELLWSILIFFVFHHFFGHKELRFLFPLIFAIPVILSAATLVIKSDVARSAAVNTFVVINLIVIWLFGQAPANTDVSTIRVMKHEQIEKVYYTDHSPLNPFGMSFEYYRLDSSYHAVDLKSNAIPDESFLLRGSYRDLKDFDLEDRARIIHSGIPPFVLNYFNIGGWADRTTIPGLFWVTPKEGL